LSCLGCHIEEEDCVSSCNNVELRDHLWGQHWFLIRMFVKLRQYNLNVQLSSCLFLLPQFSMFLIYNLKFNSLISMFKIIALLSLSMHTWFLYFWACNIDFFLFNASHGFTPPIVKDSKNSYWESRAWQQYVNYDTNFKLMCQGSPHAFWGLASRPSNYDLWMLHFCLGMISTTMLRIMFNVKS
jgi:hypothetical protein